MDKKENKDTIYVYIPTPEYTKVDCNNCENKNTKWCGGCEHNFPSVDNFDFYIPIKE